MLGMIGGETFMLAVFLLIEQKIAAEPIISLRLFKVRNVVASTLAHCTLDVCVYSLLMLLKH